MQIISLRALIFRAKQIIKRIVTRAVSTEDMSYYEVMKYRDRDSFFTGATLLDSCYNLDASDDFLSFSPFHQHLDPYDDIDKSPVLPDNRFCDFRQDGGSQTIDCCSDVKDENFGDALENTELQIVSSSSDADDTDNVSNLSSSPLSRSEGRSISRRKQPHPVKSPSLEDPSFRGVVVTMTMKWESKVPTLIMTSTYRSVKVPFTTTRRRRFPNRRNSESASTCHSDSEDEPVSYNNWKQCASCNTKKTPLWRDAEDGTPLCNACGIRYKKYHLRCFKCWHVPKKGDKITSCCSSCGSIFRQNMFKR